ncbi:MAG: galactose-1-phosphate uridylyltransferase [Candidatus Buchananbacteria bacterium]|nr:galactose-1-phosphate uridylyltransferase [Candidatus Buchananbacteria bacterium]
MNKSEIRKDYIQDKYVIIAPRRNNRPHDIEKPVRQPVPKKDCVFCPKAVDKNNTVLATTKKTAGAKEPWAVKVIANKFPSVTTDNPKAYGRQEVIVETPNHQHETEELSDSRVVEILKTYADRTKKISEDKKIDYILIFKNNGGAAGASLQHAHSQIFATEFLPPNLRDKSDKIHDYKIRTGRCVFCDVIKKEKTGPRLIFQDKHMIAFCPYASRHNYEVWLMPKRHLDNITLINEQELKSFARFLKKILKKINKLGLPYNYYFHQVIKDEDQHFYMKITPRGSVWAGVEIAAGLIINPIAPEEAAKFYRQ